jgi:hypothetical protein
MIIYERRVLWLRDDGGLIAHISAKCQDLGISGRAGQDSVARAERQCFTLQRRVAQNIRAGAD